jgi:hypothetical protein
MQRIVLVIIVVMFACIAALSIPLLPDIIVAVLQPGPGLPEDVYTALRELISTDTTRRDELVVYLIVLPTVLLAGLSESLGQSYILFVNRVNPLRFMITLAINILIFVLSFFVTVFAVWFIGRYVYGFEAAAQRSILAVGFSYQPLLLGFLSVLPYFGSYVMYLLYLIVYIRMAEILVQVGYAPTEAFIGAVLSLAIVYTMRATVGRPIIWLVNRLRNLAAGTQLERSINAVVDYRGDYFVNTGSDYDSRH